MMTEMLVITYFENGQDRKQHHYEVDTVSDHGPLEDNPQVYQVFHGAAADYFSYWTSAVVEEREDTGFLRVAITTTGAVA